MPRGGSLTSRVLCTLDEIEAIAAAWTALDAACADPLTYFQSYDWCRNWVAQFCSDGVHSAYIVTVWRNETLVALWPRMVVESTGLRRLETLGVPHSQYCGILLNPDTPASPELVEALRSAVRQSGCDVILSRAVLAGTVLDQVLNDKPQVEGSANVASVLDLSGFASAQDYVSQLGKVQKRNRNRRRNHLARLGELHFEVLWPDNPGFAGLVEQCTAMKRRWLTETGRYSSGFAMAGYADFLAGLQGDATRKSGACLSVLRAGERVVAVELGFIRNGHYYAYIGGFDWDLKDLSPGKVQMEMTVAWLIEAGISGYDLLINPASYKDSWTNRTLCVTARAEALTWKGTFYTRTWLPRMRPAIKRMHARLPMMIERVVLVLRPAACMLLYV